MRLELTLRPGPRGEAELTGIVVNAGETPIEIDLVELSSAPIALEIVDDRGQRVRMPPPATPGRPELITLAPGERREVTFPGWLPQAPPGRYRVRMRYRDAESPWVELAR